MFLLRRVCCGQLGIKRDRKCRKLTAKEGDRNIVTVPYEIQHHHSTERVRTGNQLDTERVRTGNQLDTLSSCNLRKKEKQMTNFALSLF